MEHLGRTSLKLSTLLNCRVMKAKESTKTLALRRKKQQVGVRKMNFSTGTNKDAAKDVAGKSKSKTSTTQSVPAPITSTDVNVEIDATQALPKVRRRLSISDSLAYLASKASAVAQDV